MRKDSVSKPEFGPFFYKVCAEKSREIALAMRCFNPVFTSITYTKKGKCSNPIHPCMVHVFVRDALESALSWEGLPVLRTTLRNAGQDIRFFRVLKDQDVVATTARIESVRRLPGRVIVRILTQTTLHPNGEQVAEGMWEYESKQ